MISQSGKKILEQFVGRAKALLMKNVKELLQQHYGIWIDGHQLPVEQLPTKDNDIVYTARLLRQRLQHIKAALPADTIQIEAKAVEQLVAEQAFTILNRFCALRMCEERDLITESVRQGDQSGGFLSYDIVTGQGAVAPQFDRYCWYLHSVFDELSVELPAVFDRYSAYGLLFPDETTLQQLLGLLNARELMEYFDEQTGETINFWCEDETIGWIFQYYNSLEERRRMRDESGKPRNSREMAVRNQFFTPDYVVRFLTDNSLGRLWYEMTGGSPVIASYCEYMVRREGETLPAVSIKEPTELTVLDPACGSMHFGLYAFDVLEQIYMDAWDNQPALLHSYRYTHTRESFARLVPVLILENNIFGAEIDPRALQIAALSLWLRAQRSFNQLDVNREDRPVITRSHLVLAEPMPGNKKMLRLLMEELDKPMQRLLTKVWDKMQYVGEAGLLIKMEKEIEEEIEELRKNWSKLNTRQVSLFSDNQQEELEEARRAARLQRQEVKNEFFAKVTERLQQALQEVSQQLTESEGYENALFTGDAARGFAFIELCQQRYDIILMNPPFGEGSENTVGYLNANYPTWSKNLVCAFFDRMQELLTPIGRVGAIFDRSVLIRSSYEVFRRKCFCGHIQACADTGWGVLDAMVETSTLVLSKNALQQIGIFFDIREFSKDEKATTLLSLVSSYKLNNYIENIYLRRSDNFIKLPNSVIGYYFDDEIITLFQNKTIMEHGFRAREGFHFSAAIHNRLFYELKDKRNFVPVYNGSFHTMFYTCYRDYENWEKDGQIVKAHPSYRSCDDAFLGTHVTGFGKRGDILDAHIVKVNTFFTAEGLAIPYLGKIDAIVLLSLLNSLYSQYIINLYTGQHKRPGYVNLLPMPEYQSHETELIRIVNEIIQLKRWWFSLDETNLEYRGLLAQIGTEGSIRETLDQLQQKLSADYTRYLELVKQNDDLWMDLAQINPNSEFRQTLESYKQRRPQEELLSIDNASTRNQIDSTVLAQEVIMELVGFAYGRWDISYAQQHKEIPAFGDVFDPLPFMPAVSLQELPPNYPLEIPSDGLLVGSSRHRLSIVSRVRAAIRAIWREVADDREYELCNLLGVEDLQEYFHTPQGFFDYHFKRYTKSRRKAPIYWPVSTDKGTLTVWTYYPRLDQNTVPHIIFILDEEKEQARTRLQRAQATHDKAAENNARQQQAEMQSMHDELQRIVRLPYKPNHDDGVPVTAAPFYSLFRHNAWQKECEKNWEELEKGAYDWSHLAYTLYRDRICNKAKKDWCLALTHGIEELCENKPKQKPPRKKKADTTLQGELNLE